MPLTKVRRAIVRTVLVLLVLEATYVVSANWFLASDRGRAMMNRRESLALEWGRAWTWFPGIVSVRDLAVGGRARRAEWQATVRHGRMVIWLPSLLAKHFRLLMATASGATVEVDVIPPPAAKKARKPGRGWRVSLEGLRIDPINVMRVNEHTLAGAGRLRGAARFQVRGPTEIDLGVIQYPDARLDSGHEVAAEELRLTGRLHLAPFIVGDDQLGDILAGTTGQLSVEARASGLGFLAAYLGRVPWLRITGEGHLTADLEVTDGWLAPGSRLDLVGPTVKASFFDLEARGEGEVHGIVPEGAGNTRLDLELGEFTVVRPADSARLVEGTGLTMRISNDSTAIDRPADGIALEIDLPEAVVPDFSAFSPYLPAASGLELTGGSGAIVAGISYDAIDRNGEGALELRGQRVEAAFDDVRIQARVDLRARFENVLLDEGVIGLEDGRLSIENAETWKENRLSDSGWWGRATLSQGSWQRSQDPSSETGTLSGKLQAELRDTGPMVALMERYVRRLAWFDGLMTVHDVSAAADVVSRGPRLSLGDLAITGGEKQRLEILGQLDLEEKQPHGVLFARWGPFSAAVALEEGDRDWKLTGSRSWYEERSSALRGSGEAPTGEPIEAGPSGASVAPVPEAGGRR